MAITRRTLILLQGIRLIVDASVDQTTDDLVRAWVRGWNTIAADWEAAIAELAELRDDGRWPTRAQIRRAERTTKALFLTRQALEDLVEQAQIRIVQSLPQMTETAAEYLEVIASQYPAEAGSQTSVLANLDRVDAQALEAIVRRTTEQITALHWPLTEAAYQRVQTALVRGVALGQNPKVAAARMLRRLEGGFNGGLARAVNIARTEMLDAHRQAAMAHEQANTSVLQGWQWIATLDRRTCPSCWARHGSMHSNAEFGPIDHQSGRCARLPVTKSWSDLGFGEIEEPPSLVPDARKVFSELPKAEQLAIMGPRRLELLDAGDIGWDDLSTLRKTSGWRDSYGVTPLHALAQ